jgi:hypothetical protein
MSNAMPLQRAAALWRTSAPLSLVALVAGGCGHEPSARSSETTATTASRAQISPVQQQPLVVERKGFQPGEKVTLSAKGLQSSHTTTSADGSGESSKRPSTGPRTATASP